MGYIRRKYYKAHVDLSDAQIEVLDAAFSHLNQNLHLIQDFHGLPEPISPSALEHIIQRLNGENMMEIRTQDTKDTEIRVVPLASLNINRITLGSHYLKICWQSWAQKKEGVGNHSILIELAGTLIHEAAQRITSPLALFHVPPSPRLRGELCSNNPE